ncbi:MAG: TetR/AcrR family transcriptional regulator [Dehalococcoidia bacterium]
MPSGQDSRERLLRAALKLFASRGYHNTSVADIVEESGCPRGLLYYYFSSKQQLGYAAIDEMIRILATEGAGRHLRSNGHPIDRLVKMVDELPGAPRLQSEGPLTAGIAVRMATVDEGFRKRVADAFDAVICEVEELVRQGIADGHIVQSVNPAQLAHEFAIVCLGFQFATLLGLRDVVCDDGRSSLKQYLNSLRKQPKGKGLLAPVSQGRRGGGTSRDRTHHRSMAETTWTPNP